LCDLQESYDIPFWFPLLKYHGEKSEFKQININRSVIEDNIGNYVDFQTLNEIIGMSEWVVCTQ